MVDQTCGGTELHKWKTIFVEINMSRYDHALGLRVIALVATLIQRIAKEDAASRARREFVRRCGFSVWIAETAKDS